MESIAEGGGGLRELVQKWFTDTQAPLILLQNGKFPDWFQGFTARKEAEDQLKDKPLGCFLIRLSDKAIGYILSYRGQDRCRHFVINQDQAGLFIISGDDQPHRSLRDLIEHYRTCPVQPFGEYLTSTCSQSSLGELYDVVQFGAKEKTLGGVSVQALRNYWDKQNEQHNGWNRQRNDHHQWTDHHQSDIHQPSDHYQQRDQWNNHHNDPRNVPQNEAWKHPALPPVLPSKSNRKLTLTASTGRMSVPQQAVPPVPRRSQPLTHSLSGTLPDKSPSQTRYALLHQDPHKTTAPSETQYAEIHTIQNKVERLASGGSLNKAVGPRSVDNTDFSHYDNRSYTSTAPGGVLYSELTLSYSRSHSFPRLDATTDEEGDYSASQYSPDAPERATCHSYTLQDPRGSLQPHGSTNLPYYASLGLGVGQEWPRGPHVQREEADGGWRPESKAQQEDSMYAEVPSGPPQHQTADNTYEQIPGDVGLKGTEITDAAQQWNTYETLEDLKSQESTWGKKNMAWRKLFPEYKKK
ncbi:uncharacterized protein si:ch211-112g6.4 [Esox lucius]|uniref:SH2 domain-containing protein n=1 Tax=Esox lucius TaxID=8010 RepID=A0AAY5KY87_ESOLU|nr:uncharacterized protein si:ch211-112g6.4 [Esox lucius]